MQRKGPRPTWTFSAPWRDISACLRGTCRVSANVIAAVPGVACVRADISSYAACWPAASPSCCLLYGSRRVDERPAMRYLFFARCAAFLPPAAGILVTYCCRLLGLQPSQHHCDAFFATRTLAI